jgi:hypothetical protein
MVTPVPPSARADGHPALVRRLIDLVGSFQMDAALELVTDDLVIELPFRADGGPRRMEGDDAKGFIRSLPKVLREYFDPNVVAAAFPPA